MKRVFYLLSGVALLYLFWGGMLLATSCSGDSSSDPIDEPDKPEPPKNVMLELSRTDLVFEAAGGEKTFTISCNGNWTIENESDWCTTDFTHGTGNLTVTVTVGAYDGLEDRNTNLTVKAGDKTQVLGVTQKYKDAILLSKDKYELPQEGGTVSVEVKSNISSVTATVPAEFQSWIAPAPDSRAVTTKNYDFTVSATDSTDVRSGFIVFSGNAVKDTVYVYQAQKSRLFLSQSAYDVPSGGKTLSVELKTNVNYEVEIPVAVSSWISQVATRGLRTDRLLFVIAANEDTESRSAKIAIKDRDSNLDDTLYIRQSGKPVILLDRTKFNIPQEGSVISVEVQSNIDYEVTIPVKFASWVSRMPDTRTLTAKTYRFVIAGNEEPESRSGYIVFSDNTVKDTVYLYQAQKDHLQLVADRFTPHSDGEEISVGLRTNVDYRVEIPASSASWISLLETRSLQTDALRFRVESNAGGRVRSVEIVVKDVEDRLSDTLYITQYGAPGDEQDIFTEIVSGVNLEMVYVKGGTFSMGDDTNGPVHSVTLSGYYIGKFEVTQGLWEKVMGTTIEQQREKAYGKYALYGVGSDYPIYYVNWPEAQEFCTKLSKLTGRKYALPTEAQWEYAARGGVKSKGYKYSGSNTIGDVAWNGDNSAVNGVLGTHPVGQKQANELGIYDMSGNVWEWCSDWYDSYSSGSQTNPTGPSSGSRRVLRGGSWHNNGSYCWVSFRNYCGPGNRYYAGGFRVVLLP